MSCLLLFRRKAHSNAKGKRNDQGKKSPKNTGIKKKNPLCGPKETELNRAMFSCRKKSETNDQPIWVPSNKNQDELINKNSVVPVKKGA